ncbi:MAG: FKBP-type peptidyl-prolyl cis-trans isomerase [Bacteroidota bacterium]|jgi:FKBP-type peptidyl-prolyl cis-trans isomerase FkpA|nr:FKBP-type peptidyl-prolyl cis-trans isomerase [Sphingobacteriales bacterium]
MKKSIYLFAAVAAFFASCGNKLENTESGVQYQIFDHNENERMPQAGEMLLLNFKMAIESNDSLMMETFTDNQPRYIPADEASLKEVFAKLAKGDSAVAFINADTLYQRSFGMPKPENLKAGERVKMIMKLVDIFNQGEMEKKRMEQINELKTKDSLALSGYVSTLQNVQQTTSGLRYVAEKEGTGKQAKKGSRVNVKYKGYFMNGEVFDQNMDKDEPFEFVVGLGQVIPGWDEGLSLMKEGARYKMIIPWPLAYGERGMGPILPCTSLIFDVELVKVN